MAAGFTLIELVMVIVILGILSATLTPKYTTLVDEAERSTVKGVAGSLASAGTVNWGICKASGRANVPGSSCKTVARCEDVWQLIEPEEAVALNEKYDIDEGGLFNNGIASCVLRRSAAIAASFTLLATP
ncbi:MAG: prepilin-type N-terminal cleavage/methylation domain-containing protein [Magnetococcales bacterium]|nr:prepilin-type N-terminal cleavage/methylation domain-containing protein [Magnetococcales bacterium]